jgi:N utilization substance protein A
MKLAESFATILKQIEKERGLSANDLKTAIEVAFLSAYKKKMGTSGNIQISFNKDMTELNIYHVKKVVENIQDSQNEILLEEARKIDENINLGEELFLPIFISSEDFGRLSTQVAKQVISQKLKEAEKKRFYEEYSSKKNDIVLGFVQRLEKNNIIVRIGKYENVLLPSEQIPNEKFRVGDSIKVYLTELNSFKSNTKQIILSRANPGFVRRLFEIEVPEISDGIVAIKSLVREAGYKTKIAVASLRDNFDPIGACIGPKSSRIKNILSELNGERIDIIEWSNNQQEYIKNALAPATVNKVTINDRYAHVIVPSDKLSLAIGKDGLNVKLASKLTGFHIEIESED